MWKDDPFPCSLHPRAHPGGLGRHDGRRLARPPHPVAVGFVEMFGVAGHPLARGAESTSGFRRNRESSSATCLASAKFTGCTTAMGFAIPSPESFTGQVCGGVAVAAGEVHLHLPDRIQHVLRALHRHEQPAPLDDPTPAAVQDDPAAPEDETGPDGGEHRAEEDDENGRQGPRRALHGDEPQGNLHDKEACQQEGQPEDRKAAAPAAKLDGTRIPVIKRGVLPLHAGLFEKAHFRTPRMQFFLAPCLLFLFLAPWTLYLFLGQ